jgi:hypothetical protein
MTTTEIAQRVLACALGHCYDQSELESWAPEEYTSLESDDRNLVDMEIERLLAGQPEHGILR